MKVLKALICCVFAIFVAFAAGAAMPVKPASAAARYARADARDIYFCERKDLNYALFTIPYTYCVEILSSDGQWYYVKYAEDAHLYRALYGYCLCESLTVVEQPPENIYLNMPITVTFKADTPTGALPVLSDLTVTAAFYGTYYAGATAYSYVLYDGTFGYVYGANDDYPLNQIPEPDLPPEEQPAAAADTKLITAIALAALAAVALIILYMTGRRRYYKP